MEFVDKVRKLTNEGLTKMVKHIENMLPQSILNTEPDKVQISVDHFDKDTLNKMTDFVEELIINEQPSKR